MRSFDALGKHKVIIGLLHLLPSPGTPHYEEGNFEKSLEKAVAGCQWRWKEAAQMAA